MVIMCAMSSIVFFFVGYACGWSRHKHKQSHASRATSDSVEKNSCNYKESQLPQTPGPLCEELQMKSTPEHDQLVDLKENINVAYGPIAK